MEHAVLRFLSTLSERLLRQELVALLDCVETALRPLAGPSKDFPMEGRWDLGGSLALIAPFDRQVSIARVGDFRVVRLRDGHLDVLAREHTLRAQLDSEGQAMPPHADFGNVIVAYLGGSLPIPDDAISTFDVEAGDRIAIFENPGSRAVNEDLPILSSVCNLTPEESAKRVLDASLARSTGQVVGRAVGIIDVVE